MTKKHKFYDIICHGCKKTQTVESDILPTTVKHFVKIAQSLKWKFLIDDEEERLLYFCSAECVAKVLGEMNC